MGGWCAHDLCLSGYVYLMHMLAYVRWHECAVLLSVLFY